MQLDTRSEQPRTSLQEWRELMRRVASQNELSDDLVNLVSMLKLPLECSLAVQKVLREGNWAKAEHPNAYIKKAAMTQARKMHLAIPHKDDTLECGEQELVFMDGAELNERWNGCKLARVSEDSGVVKGVRPPPIMPLKGKHSVKAQFAPDEEVLAREEEALESGPFWPSDCWTAPKVPKWLSDETKSFHDANPDEYLVIQGPSATRDWQKLGMKAGLDPWEITVLEYRSQGISRDRAMELQSDEASRKAIQAAWRRFDRTGLKRLQDFLGRIPPWNVPDEPSPDTRNIEGCAPPHSKAASPGNPLKEAWKRSGGRSREDLGRFLIKYRGRAPHLRGSLVTILDSECPG